MGKPTGFNEYKRENAPKRAVSERVKDYNEIEQLLESGKVEIQASRCMDCGIPFCHAYGCPISNRIPDFNDLVYHKQWKRAVDLLHKTNNFPEFTGRLCPAICEEACTLAINSAQVSIRLMELHIVEMGFRNGWIVPQLKSCKSGKRIAVIGSGPAGLSAAQQLARKGHEVTVIEQAEKAGGLLRYGIPDFKLNKAIIDRRLNQLTAEGVVFETGVRAGEDLSKKYLLKNYNAIVLATGSRVPRDIKIQGRELSGIHFALDFLSAQNQRVSHESLSFPDISAKGKRVLVIGGGDTGSDCVGTSIRQGAISATQIEIMPKPEKERAATNPWPTWPSILRTSTSHEEGCERMWGIQTLAFEGKNGVVQEVRCASADGKEFIIKADIVLLAMGFVHPCHDKLISDLDIKLTDRGNILVDAEGVANKEVGVFAAGDCSRGASLIVWAIESGRNVAEAVNRRLNHKT